jgi:hypothetical protein
LEEQGQDALHSSTQKYGENLLTGTYLLYTHTNINSAICPSDTADFIVYTVRENTICVGCWLWLWRESQVRGLRIGSLVYSVRLNQD